MLVYDRLVADEIVREAPIGALRISRDGLSQDDINALLVAHGRRGRRVVRLKGGDPFVFGRGGEEALALVRAGVPFELVPGVSSIAAVPESAGIPVTHRGVSQMVTAFAANDVEQLDARALAQIPGHARRLHGRRASSSGSRERLIEHGKPASTPAAVVSRGTTEDEEVRRRAARLDRCSGRASADAGARRDRRGRRAARGARRARALRRSAA